MPITVTAENFGEAVRENILQSIRELSYKLNVFDSNPARDTLDANNSRIRLVADAVHPADAVNLRTLLEFANAL